MMSMSIRYAKTFEDGSGERVSLEIDTKEDEEFMVKINDNCDDDDLVLSLKDLFWLRDHIDKALGFIEKEESKDKKSYTNQD